MMKIKNQKVTITTQETITVDDLCYIVADILPIEAIPYFVAKLDLLSQDWSVTEELISHYLHMNNVHKKEMVSTGEEQARKPKEIKVKF